MKFVILKSKIVPTLSSAFSNNTQMTNLDFQDVLSDLG